MKTILKFDPQKTQSLEDFAAIKGVYGFSNLELDLQDMYDLVWHLNRGTERVFSDYMDCVMVFSNEGSKGPSLQLFYSEEDFRRHENKEKKSKVHFVTLNVA